MRLNRLTRILLLVTMLTTLIVAIPNFSHITYSAPQEENHDNGDNKESKDDSDKIKEDVKEENEKAESKIKGKDSEWTLYAQIIMGSAIEKKEKDDDRGFIKKAFDGAVSGIIGNGGVDLNVPYAKFSYLNKELTGKDVDKYEGGEKGQKLASILATYNHYGYIQSVSGNKIAVEFMMFFSDIGRSIGGVIAYIAIVFHAVITGLLDVLLKALVILNPYSLLGLDKGETALPDNPISKIVKDFFDAIGLKGTFFTTLIELGTIIIAFLFIIRMMINLGRVRFMKASHDLYQWIVRLFVIFGAIPVLCLMSASVAKTVHSMVSTTHIADNPAMSHLVDARAWASGLNLSPNALKSNKAPHVSAEENYIDTEYEPSRKASRNLISDINTESYKRLYGNTDETDISFKLVNKWLNGSTFNVNTYVADLRTKNNLPGIYNFKEEYSRAKKLSSSQKEKLSSRDLESVMWSSTQNTDEELRKPDHENYDPTMPIGVYNDTSFSTQSVILLLQSSFDTSTVNFYSYNLAPKGEQTNQKNVSTIKTGWREVSLPGDGVFGAFASWLSLVSKSIVYVMLSLSIIMALLSSVFVQGFYKFIKQIFQSIVFGSVHSVLATFLIYLGMVGSIVMSVGLPGAFIKVIESLQSFILTISFDKLPSIFLELLSAIISVGVAYWLSFGGRITGSNETPVRLIVTFFINMALAFEARVAEMNRAGVTNFRATGIGLRQAGRSELDRTSETIKAGAVESGNAMKYGTRGALAGGSRGVVKGAVIGGATGGVGGALAGATKSGLKGATKGAMLGSQNRQGSIKDFTSAMEGAGLGALSKKSLLKDFSERGSKRFAHKMGKANEDGLMTNEMRNQSMSRYQLLKANEMADGIDENAVGADKYKNLLSNPDALFSDNITVDKSSMDELTGDQYYYDNISASEIGEYSLRAGVSAKEALTEDNRIAFTSDEIEQLSSSTDENDFVDRLLETHNGFEYAMQTENATNMLQGSQFTDDEGEVSMAKINKFVSSTDKAVANGDVLDKSQLRDKALLDSAFVVGAKEKYRKPSAKFTDKIGSTKANNYNSGYKSHSQNVAKESEAISKANSSGSRNSAVKRRNATSNLARKRRDLARSHSRAVRPKVYKTHSENNNANAKQTLKKQGSNKK
ncbi:Got1/Sft2-like family vesicle transport protein [Staphylococcus chromogenes]|uniref:Got1/Sft2-like family vesicle transport protein n=1 Tax=Staphylococcus chromogenes TaxID=46126 RepID=UPI00188DC9E0|nr:Got1/Sft2-like family vesicle transport protein [Staphylococcus chromogenes]